MKVKVLGVKMQSSSYRVSYVVRTLRPALRMGDGYELVAVSSVSETPRSAHVGAAKRPFSGRAEFRELRGLASLPETMSASKAGQPQKTKTKARGLRNHQLRRLC